MKGALCFTVSNSSWVKDSPAWEWNSLKTRNMGYLWGEKWEKEWLFPLPCKDKKSCCRRGSDRFSNWGKLGAFVEICAHVELSYCCCCGSLSSSQLHPTLMRNHFRVPFHRYFCAQIKKESWRTNFQICV